MKKIISLLAACLMIVFLSVGVMADDPPADAADTEDDERTVVSVDNGNGHEFSAEELPEFQDDDGEGIIPPAPVETQPEETPSEEAMTGDGSSDETNALIPIAIASAVLAAGAVTAVIAIRKKRDPSRAKSGETK